MTVDKGYDKSYQDFMDVYEYLLNIKHTRFLCDRCGPYHRGDICLILGHTLSVDWIVDSDE